MTWFVTNNNFVASLFRNLLNKAELQHVWKGLLSNESVVKRAWDVSIVFGWFVCLSQIGELICH